METSVLTKPEDGHDGQATMAKLGSLLPTPLNSQ